MNDTGRDVAKAQMTADWGSDAIAELLRALEIPYIALTPGASFRGLHDSLVNYLGNTRPELLLCVHEEHAVALAHGYARVTGKPLAVALHANVGLMHATMAIFNAWCDRIPILLLGAVGPIEIFTGLRVGFALTLIGCLLAEMFASQRGLGYLLMNGIGLHNVELIMSVTLLIIVFAATVSVLLLQIDLRLHRRV